MAPLLSGLLSLVALYASATVALDIPGLLSSLGPAPANDPRFTNFQKPGPNDGASINIDTAYTTANKRQSAPRAPALMP